MVQSIRHHEAFRLRNRNGTALDSTASMPPVQSSIVQSSVLLHLTRSLSPLQAKLIYGPGRRRAALVTLLPLRIIRLCRPGATRARAASAAAASARTIPLGAPSAASKVSAPTVSCPPRNDEIGGAFHRKLSTNNSYRNNNERKERNSGRT